LSFSWSSTHKMFPVSSNQPVRLYMPNYPIGPGNTTELAKRSFYEAECYIKSIRTTIFYFVRERSGCELNDKQSGNRYQTSIDEHQIWLHKIILETSKCVALRRWTISISFFLQRTRSLLLQPVLIVTDSCFPISLTTQVRCSPLRP